LTRQISRPLPASSATHWLGAVTYMIPSTTTGVVCSTPASGSWNIHRGASRATDARSICVSVVWRLPPVPPL